MSSSSSRRKEMNILILGCGKAGVRLARLLDSKGHDVSVVDHSQARLELLGDNFSGMYAAGEVFDLETLLSIGADNADAAVILSQEDNSNIMAAQLLKKQFNIEKIYTRILDPAKEEVFRGMGFETICSTSYEVSHIYDAITSDEEEMSAEIFGKSYSFEILATDKHDYGKTPGELELMKNEMVFAIKRESGEVISANTPELKIQPGDKVILAKF